VGRYNRASRDSTPDAYSDIPRNATERVTVAYRAVLGGFLAGWTPTG